MERLTKVPELARIVRAEDSTVYSWVRSGKVPCLRIGRFIRFTPEQVRQITGIDVHDGGSAPRKE